MFNLYYLYSEKSNQPSSKYSLLCTYKPKTRGKCKNAMLAKMQNKNYDLIIYKQLFSR